MSTLTMGDIRSALMGLCDEPGRAEQFHSAIIALGHKWRGEIPTLEDVQGMMLMAVSMVTRGATPYWCGRAGSGGIYAQYFVWPSGGVQVELYYTPNIASRTVDTVD